MFSNLTIREKIMSIIFISLYILVSFVSISHLFEFIQITDSTSISVLQSIGYALGTAASIFSFTLLNKANRGLVLTLFVILMIMEIIGNVYHAYTHLDLQKVKLFSELLGVDDFESKDQKRIFALLVGLPIVLISMGYIKVLINYIFPTNQETKLEEKKEVLEPLAPTIKEESIKPAVIEKKVELTPKPIEGGLHTVK